MKTYIGLLVSEKKLECFHTSCHLSEGLEGKELGGDSRNCPVGGKGLVGVGIPLSLSWQSPVCIYLSHQTYKGRQRKGREHEV